MSQGIEASLELVRSHMGRLSEVIGECFSLISLVKERFSKVESVYYGLLGGLLDDLNADLSIYEGVLDEYLCRLNSKVSLDVVKDVMLSVDNLQNQIDAVRLVLQFVLLSLVKLRDFEDVERLNLVNRCMGEILGLSLGFLKLRDLPRPKLTVLLSHEYCEAPVVLSSLHEVLALPFNDLMYPQRWVQPSST